MQMEWKGGGEGGGEGGGKGGGREEEGRRGREDGGEDGYKVDKVKMKVTDEAWRLPLNSFIAIDL